MFQVYFQRAIPKQAECDILAEIVPETRVKEAPGRIRVVKDSLESWSQGESSPEMSIRIMVLYSQLTASAIDTSLGKSRATSPARISYDRKRQVVARATPFSINSSSGLRLMRYRTHRLWYVSATVRAEGAVVWLTCIADNAMMAQNSRGSSKAIAGISVLKKHPASLRSYQSAISPM
jgi:hypothetical protein